MKCVEAQKKIESFVNDKLSKKDLERFLEHMESCEACKEEYEIYYTLITGMHLLEEESIAGNFYLNANEKLWYAKDYLVKYRIGRMVAWIIFIALILIIMLFFQ